jgi:hypothetical protein
MIMMMITSNSGVDVGVTNIPVINMDRVPA